MIKNKKVERVSPFLFCSSAMYPIIINIILDTNIEIIEIKPTVNPLTIVLNFFGANKTMDITNRLIIKMIRINLINW